MAILVGSTDVSSSFFRFFSNRKTAVDGNFKGRTETGAYKQALTVLKNQLLAEVPAQGIEGQTKQEAIGKIKERFQTYAMLVNDNCEGTDKALPIVQGLYEELTQLIESAAFKTIPQEMQDSIVALQAECFTRLKQEGTHRGVERGGTSIEIRTSNHDPFRSNPEVLERVPKAAEQLIIEGKQCIGVVGGEDLNLYYSEGKQPYPFPDTIDSKRFSINMDVRYPLDPNAEPARGLL
ncbi:MAG: hypothetical protein KKA31_05670, partial [Candidatus Margulisbacteria bacterium]|nr:hypothetical protein [Candidatus Margulisiibacteriota bacterium]